MREARAAARMNHPNLIQVYDLIRHDKFWFIVMEYFPSRSLLDVVEQSGALEFGKAVKVIRQVTAALLHANEMNIVHRDVKPGNILIGRDWVAKLSDFGLAKSRTIVSEDEADGRVTRVGAIVGTPAYISPEQVLAVSDIDVRSDIYCLGLCFHYMLEGKHPFVGEVSELLAMQIKTPVPELTVPGVPEAAKAIIRKMAHKDREKRFSDPGRLLSALGEL